MKKTLLTLITVIFIFSLLGTGGAAASVPAVRQAQAALATSFTYQGQLKQDNTTVNGECDFQFELWDDPSAGAQIGRTLDAPNTQVSNGRFTVTLDFGSNAFTSDGRWLEIAVRCPPGSGDFAPLSPRRELTASPYALYSQAANSAPWSGLTDVPAGFADGIDNDTTYTAGDGLTLSDTQFSMLGTSYANVVIVAKSGGDYTTIQAALDSITDASDANRYLVWVAPGVYNERVTMKQYVNIQGAGTNSTRITSTGSSSIGDAATITLADNVEIRDLTIENTGNNTYAIGLQSDSGSPQVDHVNVLVNASEGSVTVTYGMYFSTSTPNVSNSTIIATGGSSSNHGIGNASCPSASFTNLSITVSGGAASRGLYNINSSITLRDSIVDGGYWGVNNTLISGDYIVTIQNSQVTGSTSTVYSASSNYTVTIGGSFLGGGAVSGGTTTCAGVYDEDYAFYASSCP